MLLNVQTWFLNDVHREFYLPGHQDRVELLYFL